MSLRPRATQGAAIVIEDADGAAVFQFDATVNETHSRSAIATAHPIEEGANISDHIQLEPKRLELVAVRSSTPMFVDSVVSNRDIVSFEELESILERASTISVETSLVPYDNLAFVRLTVRRDAASGQAIFAAMVFEEIVKVAGRSVLIPAEVLSPELAAGGSSEENAGRQGVDEADGEQAEVAASWAVQALGSR